MLANSRLLKREQSMLYDRNLTHRLVLDDTHYRPMIAGEATVPLAECDRAYLKQRHYVARTVPAGLSVATTDLLDGWVEASAWTDNARRR